MAAETAKTCLLTQQVLCLRTKPRSPDPANLGLSTSMTPLDLGLTVISKLLAEHTFLPPHSGTVSGGFPIPEGDALQNPVCAAICELVDDAVSVDAVRQCLYMGTESITETDDEGEEGDGGDGQGKAGGDGGGGSGDEDGRVRVGGKVVSGCGGSCAGGDSGGVVDVRGTVGGGGSSGVSDGDCCADAGGEGREGGEGGWKSNVGKKSGVLDSNNGDACNSLSDDDGEHSGTGACLMENAHEKEDERDTVSWLPTV